MAHDSLPALTAGILTAIGIYALVWPGKAQIRIEAAHRQKLDARIARGSDAYFDELRSLQAYGPKQGLRRRRLIGAAFAVLGLSYFVSVIYG